MAEEIVEPKVKPEVSDNIGEIKLTDTISVKIRKTEFKSGTYIDIRKFATTENYEGWTKKGIALSINKIPELIKLLQKALE